MSPIGRKILFLQQNYRIMIDTIKQHIEEAKAFNDKNKEALEAFRIKYLGSKGLLKAFFNEFKNIPNDQKKEFGQVINTLKAGEQTLLMKEAVVGYFLENGLIT